MATHYAKDGKSAYDICREYPDCPVRIPTGARCMTSAKIDFEGVQDNIINWYEQNVINTNAKGSPRKLKIPDRNKEEKEVCLKCGYRIDHEGHWSICHDQTF